MNIGQCSICLGNFTASDMAVLRQCMHTFHRDCIGRALRIRRDCPLCRGETHPVDVMSPVLNATPMPDNLNKKALDIALGYYDKLVITKQPGNQNPGVCCSNQTDQREQLQICLQSLLSTIEDREFQKEEEWDRVMGFIKVASVASICAILALLCYLFWPLIAPIAGRLASTVWSLITSLRTFIQTHQPELIGTLFGLMELFIVWKGSDEEGEQSQIREEEQQNEE